MNTANMKHKVKGYIFQRKQKKQLEKYNRQRRQYDFERIDNEEIDSYYTYEQLELLVPKKYDAFKNHKKLVIKVTETEEKAIKWAKENGFMMEDEATCPKCIQEGVCLVRVKFKPKYNPDTVKLYADFRLNSDYRQYMNIC